jgi:Uma2 family endonuclease
LADSEPQPDLAVLLPYAQRRPRTPPLAAEVILLIEVSDTTIAYDRAVKVPLYGRAGIPEVWLADLVQGTVEVYRGPSPAGYRTKETFGPGDMLRAEGLQDIVLSVADFMGAPPAEA